MNNTINNLLGKYNVNDSPFYVNSLTGTHIYKGSTYDSNMKQKHVIVKKMINPNIKYHKMNITKKELANYVKCSVSNKHFVRMYDIVRTKENVFNIYTRKYDTVNILFIVCEYIDDCKTLFQMMVDMDDIYDIDEKEIMINNYIKQFQNILQYSQTSNILLDTFNPRDIFVTQNNIIKIKSFGIYSFFDNNIKKYQPIYHAPECMSDMFEHNGNNNIWSIAVIIFEMMHGYNPYAADTQHFCKECIIINKIYDVKLQNMLKKMLVVESKNRMTCDEFVKY